MSKKYCLSLVHFIEGSFNHQMALEAEKALALQSRVKLP